jgi:hypothetical protein
MSFEIPKYATGSVSPIKTVPSPKPRLAELFRRHADQWWKETRVLSSIQAKIFNPNYQRIIGMGEAALPFIFADLNERGGQWYWALECITGENPALEAGSLPEARLLWLDWAREHKYL